MAVRLLVHSNKTHDEQVGDVPRTCDKLLLRVFFCTEISGEIFIGGKRFFIYLT